MRTFLAVTLPDRLRAELAALQDRLRAARAEVNWVEPAHLHLTLKFLGEMAEARLPELAAALTTAVSAIPRFTLCADGVGAFPTGHHPRVIWVGLGRDLERLGQLARAVDAACAGLGFPAETRPFAAHVTLGRVRTPHRLAALSESLVGTAFASTTEIPVTAVTVFESRLSSRGPTYVARATVALIDTSGRPGGG